MRSLRRNLEVQLDTPWLLTSRRTLIADELFRHMDDHRACLEEEEGLPQDLAWAEAWAAFGDLKAVAGDFLAQHRLEAYAFYAAFVALFAGLLWPLPTVLNFWITGDPAAMQAHFTWGHLGNRLLVTWEIFWLFVLVRTAHCAARGPVGRWTVIGLLFPGYVILGVLTPYLLSYVAYTAAGYQWFDPKLMAGWVGLIQANSPAWLLSDSRGIETFIVTNIIAIYLIRAYTVEGCWKGRDWPQLLIMSLLLIMGLMLFVDVAPERIQQLTLMTRNVENWAGAGLGDRVLAVGLSILKHLLLVGYFVGSLRAADALYGAVVRTQTRNRSRQAMLDGDMASELA